MTRSPHFKAGVRIMTECFYCDNIKVNDDFIWSEHDPNCPNAPVPYPKGPGVFPEDAYFKASVKSLPRR
jgi:hypothetical protein